MSILGSVLEGIAQGLEIPSENVQALKHILEPESFDSREGMAHALGETIGYDPETFWNRHDLGVIYDEDHDDSECGSDDKDRSDFVDAALASFNSLRQSVLRIAADKWVPTTPDDTPLFPGIGEPRANSDGLDLDALEYRKLPHGQQAEGSLVSDLPCMPEDDEDEDEESITALAKRLGDAEFGPDDDDPTILDDDDEDDDDE